MIVAAAANETASRPKLTRKEYKRKRIALSEAVDFNELVKTAVFESKEVLQLRGLVEKAEAWRQEV